MILAVLCELLEAYNDVLGGGAVGAYFIVGWLLGGARAHSVFLKKNTTLGGSCICWCMVQQERNQRMYV